MKRKDSSPPTRQAIQAEIVELGILIDKLDASTGKQARDGLRRASAVFNNDMDNGMPPESVYKVLLASRRTVKAMLAEQQASDEYNEVRKKVVSENDE